jgi:hypothetical protein
MEGGGAGELHEAAAGGDLERVQGLLDAGADACEGSREGMTPLMLAAQNGHAEVVRALLQAGAPWNALSPSGQCAGDFAMDAGHQEAFDILLDAGKSLPGNVVEILRVLQVEVNVAWIGRYAGRADSGRGSASREESGGGGGEALLAAAGGVQRRQAAGRGEQGGHDGVGESPHGSPCESHLRNRRPCAECGVWDGLGGLGHPEPPSCVAHHHRGSP